jgi:hypothetical protein
MWRTGGVEAQGTWMSNPKASGASGMWIRNDFRSRESTQSRLESHYLFTGRRPVLHQFRSPDAVGGGFPASGASSLGESTGASSSERREH